MLASPAHPLFAQGSEVAVRASEHPLAVGGELAAMLAPPDDHTYFNYTDYDHDALRMARLRLFGEWHATDRLSLLVEIRTENASTLSASALYLRWQPMRDRGLYVQAGRVPPVFGAFGRRAYGRDNAVLSLPLAYQYLTSLRTDAVPATAEDLLYMRGQGWAPYYPVGDTTEGPGIPLISGSRWDTGVQTTWENTRLSLSGGITLGSPADPVVRDTNDGVMWAGRAAAHVPGGITIGVSGARAQWLARSLLEKLAEGTSTPSHQSVFGIDLEVGSGPWLVRAEAMRSNFDVPFAAEVPSRRLTATAAFVETRYRFHPRLQVGARIDRLAFGAIRNPAAGAATPWDYPVVRVETLLGVRMTRHVEARGGWQYNRRTSAPPESRHLPTIGLLVWF